MDNSLGERLISDAEELINSKSEKRTVEESLKDIIGLESLKEKIKEKKKKNKDLFLVL